MKIKIHHDSPSTTFKMCNDAVNVKGIQPYVKTNILNYEKDFHSPIFVIDKRGLCKVRTGWRRMADGGWRIEKCG